MKTVALFVSFNAFSGFLLRKALKEELEGIVVRWPDAPPGKVHEAR